MPSKSVDEKIKETAELALRYFNGLLKEKLGDKFSETVVNYLPIDKANFDIVTRRHVLANFKGNILHDAATPEYLFNVIKEKVKKLADKVLKDLKACQPAKIQFVEAPGSTPYPSNICIDLNTHISLRLTFGTKFAANKLQFEITVYYLILPTGDNQNG